jgi:D-alanine-D-alanine ligase
MKRIGVLMGGTSAEREVSLRTGAGILDALTARGIKATSVMLGDHEPFDVTIRRANIDVAFLALHGRGGEDGCIQGMLELMGIPYTGSSVLGSALAMDKVKAKEMFRLHNVPTPPYYVATDSDLADVDALHASFGYPVIVKPRSEGSSVGVTKAEGAEALRKALASALEHDDYALVERFVVGAEIHVGLLNGRVLGAVEVVPKSGTYDYHSKYTPGATDYYLPPRSLSSARMLGIYNLAERAVSALECTGACRVDLLVTPGENEYVLEVNTLPGMTATSLLPKIAASAGINYGELCERIVEGAKLHSRLHKEPASRKVGRTNSSSLVDSDDTEYALAANGE